MLKSDNYKSADKSLAQITSRCILSDGENSSFDASLVIYINSINFPPIVIINRIYETQNLLSLYLVSFLVGLRTYQHPCNNRGADKSLARPGRKQATVTEDFDVHISHL